jgi:hypothetical protein
MQDPLEPMQLSLDECMHTTSQSRAGASALLWLVSPVNHTGQTGVLDRPAPEPPSGQTGVPHRSGWWPPGKNWELPELKTSSKPLENLLNACSKPKHAQASPPCWQCMNQAKNAKIAT